MATLPRFSVLVSSFNYADYVADAVRSALAQTHAPFEIIVVDDGSSDDSVARLHAAFGGDARVRIVVKENGGQMSSWVEAFRHASGDIIALLDSDDLWQPEYLARNAAVFDSLPTVDYVYCNQELFGAHTGLRLRKWRHRRSRDLGLSVLLGTYVQRWQGAATSGNCIRRDLFARLLDLPADQIPEWKSRPDDCLFYGSDILGAHKYYLADALVRHRQHSRNAKLEFRQSPIKSARYSFRFRRMIDHYRRRAGVTDDWLKAAKQEFRTKPRPLFSEWLVYCGLAWRSPYGLSSALNQFAAITGHYLKSLMRGAG